MRRVEIEPAVKECHMVVVSESEARRLDKLIEFINGAPILTVGESSGFARNGGIINLVPENGKIGLEVNAAAAKHTHLSLSSRLLSLAKIVP